MKVEIAVVELAAVALGDDQMASNQVAVPLVVVLAHGTSSCKPRELKKEKNDGDDPRFREICNILLEFL